MFQIDPSSSTIKNIQNANDQQKNKNQCINGIIGPWEGGRRPVYD